MGAKRGTPSLRGERERLHLWQGRRLRNQLGMACLGSVSIHLMRSTRNTVRIGGTFVSPVVEPRSRIPKLRDPEWPSEAQRYSRRASCSLKQHARTTRDVELPAWRGIHYIGLSHVTTFDSDRTEQIIFAARTVARVFSPGTR